MSDFEQLTKTLRCRLPESVAADVREEVRTLSAIYDNLTGELIDEPSKDTVPSATRTEDGYNALLSVYEDPRHRSESGLLAGVRVGVKDNIAVKGLEMTCGLRGMSFVPDFDAVVVERLLDAGATIVGKTNMDALAFGPAGQWSELGRVSNPMNPDRVPGGSSSGSGAAVAAGLVDVALGSDTGGSIRSPAACCGVVGIRPTHGLVPRHGFVELAPSADTIGPIARDVETAASVLKTISGFDHRDRSSKPVPANTFDEIEHPPIVGVIRETIHAATSRVRDSLNNTLHQAAASEQLVVRECSVDIGNIDRAFSICMGAEFSWLVKQSFVVRGQGATYEPSLAKALDSLSFNEHVASRILPGAILDEETGGHAYSVARQAVSRFNDRLNDLFQSVDVLLTPTLRILPPRFGEVTSSEDGMNYSFTKPFSLTGGPSVSVPVGRVEGLPVSAQILAPAYKDGLAIQVAQILESISEGHTGS